MFCLALAGASDHLSSSVATKSGVSSRKGRVRRDRDSPQLTRHGARPGRAYTSTPTAISSHSPRVALQAAPSERQSRAALLIMLLRISREASYAACATHRRWRYDSGLGATKQPEISVKNEGAFLFEQRVSFSAASGLRRKSGLEFRVTHPGTCFEQLHVSAAVSRLHP